MGKKVQVVFASLEGKLPAGERLPLAGNMLLSAGRGRQREEAVVPLSLQGVHAILVFGDLANPGRLGDLALYCGQEMMKLGEGDEIVMLKGQAEALGLTHAVGVTTDSGAELTMRAEPLYDLFRLAAK